MHFIISLVNLFLLFLSTVCAETVKRDSDDPSYGGPAIIPPRSKLIAHAALSAIGFIVFLPIGSIVARYRTVNPFWFKMHYFIQTFAALLIIPGFALGINYNGSAYDPEVEDTDHGKYGIALFALYLAQVLIGLIIHYVKPKNVRRPPQNYLHAILGLLVLSLAFYQVRQGFREEWPNWTSELAPNGVEIAWIVWLAVVGALYVVGLALLPRQYRREQRDEASPVVMEQTHKTA